MYAALIAGTTGVGFAFLFAVVGVLNFQIILVPLAFFVYGAATTESRAVLVDELPEGITVGGIATREAASVPATTSLASLGDRMLRERTTVHVVTDESGAAVGVASERRPGA
ncbi:hypothetical protein ACFQJD_06420 [Haloplanus sp. GCM10025708]|uniref:hypothetical protein n=1 Tax=Haloferacaceae TaxID=1644056 RepID=UPI003610CC72